MIDRMKRVEELVKREISVVVQTLIEDPIVFNVTITSVRVSKDLRNAKVFFSVGDKGSTVHVKEALQKYASFIRGELGSKINLKRTPKLVFVEDDFEVYRKNIEDIFSRIDEKRKDEYGFKDDINSDQ